MKKYIVIIISLTFLISGYSVAISRQINQKSSNYVGPVDIYKKSSMEIAPLYSRKTSTTDIYFTQRAKYDSNGGFNYVIITDANLVNSITSSTFLPWKETLGFNIKIVNISDSLIQNQPGDDLPAKIRNFLIEYYQTWGIYFVLIVGDHETVPMRYCYPDPENHNFDVYDWSTGGEVPTDYYYADLSDSDNESWDSDGDGFYGEFNEDELDFIAEVYVGRIPTSNSSKIMYTLDKIVSFEQDTGVWKNNALHAGAILFYKNENHRYEIDHDIDGASCLYAIEENIMNNWTINHYSENEGLSPSKYNWKSLTEPVFTSDWRTGKYAVVNWAGHGSSTGVGRTIWDWDDGDGIPESSDNEIIGKPLININSHLEDDYPSIVFAVSCLVGFPEPTGYGNLGIDMLTKESFGGAVGICSATRPAAISSNFSQTHSGAEALCYEFNHYMIDGPDGPESIGEALYKAKSYVHYNFGWDDWYYEYKNMYNYNLYGDPSMRREGISDPQMNIEIIHPEKGMYFNNNKISPFFTTIMVGKALIQTKSSNDIQYVKFYVDDNYMNSDLEEPFEWFWNEIAFFKHTVKVVAYDSFGNHTEDEIIIWKFF